MEGLKSSQERVNTFYEKNPNYRIIHNNLKNMKNVTSSQTYQKGSWILHMLRGLVGTENFWKGIQIYYQKYKDSNATTNDFKRTMEEVSGQNLTVFFQQWLYKPGALELSGNWKYDNKEQQVLITLNQVQTDGSLFEMPIELGINFKGDQHQQIELLQVKEKSTVFKIKVEDEPENIILDPNSWVLMRTDFKKIISSSSL